MPKLIRLTTAPLSLKYLLPGQMRYMRENGFDVLMVSSDGPEREEVIRNEGCRHQIIPMTRKITPFADLRSLWLLYKLFKKEKPDIVHSHTPKGGLLAMLAAKMAGIKIRVHTIAGLRFMTAKGFTRKVLVSMEKLTAKAASNVWPNSFSLLEYIKTNKLVNPKKLEVISLGSSNGINLQRFSASALRPEKMSEIKKLIAYDEKLIYFLSVGRIVHDKGMDELLNAFIGVHKQNDHTRLLLVGAFEDELDPISDNARQILKTHPAVIQAGWNDAVEYFMHFSYALVHPSHREGFPNVLMQAGAMYCPVIASRIEGNVDIVDHEKTGLLFGVMNEKELLQKLEQSLAQPALMKEYANNLRQKIEQYFDQKMVHRKMKERYLELLNK
ncbi:MAG: glycosyltransferase family 4 protein [Chitinophagaceae bacterium]